MIRSLTLDDYFGGLDKKYAEELTMEMRMHAQHTVDMANSILNMFGQFRGVNSGWRPAAVNARIPGAASRSKHLTCQAIDLSDRDLDLARWCVDHQNVLQSLGLWMEDPRWTIGWAHLQTVSPTSGNRIFIPSTKAPTFEAIQHWIPYKDKLLAI